MNSAIKRLCILLVFFVLAGVEANTEKPIFPVNGIINARFGTRVGSNVTGTGFNKFHSGIDIAAPYGFPVMTSLSGIVTFAEHNRSGYGLLVVILGSDKHEYYYAHLSRILTKTGKLIRQGDYLGNIGATGMAVGPHLHFEIRISGKPVDPLKYLVFNPASRLGL
jgi:murein DD-endopeptidase MepM/ murein hydrolase activator NlpD